MLKRCWRVPDLSDGLVYFSVVEVSKPEVSIQEAREDGMVLQCESGGWYPEPELEWRDSEGRLLPADVTQTDRLPDPGPHQRYTVTSRVTVQKTDTNRFTCRVHLQRLNQIRETEIHVPGEVLYNHYWFVMRRNKNQNLNSRCCLLIYLLKCIHGDISYSSLVPFKGTAIPEQS